MSSAVYASGEVPMVGDVVECVDPSGNGDSRIGKRYTVTGCDDVDETAVLLHFKELSGGAYAFRFDLIRRKQEPAMSGTVVKGPPPPDGCRFAWVHNGGPFGWKLMNQSDGRCGEWPKSIAYHIPLAPPPELPPAPIALPKVFRAKYAGEDCVGAQFENEDRKWFVRGFQFTYGDTAESRDSHLQHINFIDPA